ncbi:MAG TPA: hypothetical protein VGO16_15580 [Pseudonocardiaceae bacterium]|nr:hypothetical protein [Pseudonocardiaceae bacterium]
MSDDAVMRATTSAGRPDWDHPGYRVTKAPSAEEITALRTG